LLTAPTHLMWASCSPTDGGGPRHLDHASGGIWPPLPHVLHGAAKVRHAVCERSVSCPHATTSTSHHNLTSHNSPPHTHTQPACACSCPRTSALAARCTCSCSHAGLAAHVALRATVIIDSHYSLCSQLSTTPTAFNRLITLFPFSCSVHLFHCVHAVKSCSARKCS